MKKRVLKVLTFVFIAISILYVAIFIDTNAITKEVKNAFLWESGENETLGRSIDIYNVKSSFPNETPIKIDLTLIRLLVLHNFNDGYIWAYYDYAAYKADGSLLTGSWGIFTKWKIHKANGKWEIVKIIEAP